MRERIEADWTWTGDRFEAGLQVAVGDDGRILEVGRSVGPATRRLAGQALLPGFVNAHSHAFQRGLRGLTDSYPDAAGDFWSWREAMYGLVETLDADAFTELATRTFREMRDAGITTVGEFHYLHHAPGGEADFRLDDAILAAARATGIRLVLLEAFYQTGGIGRPLAGAQRRFATPDLEGYWRQIDRLADRLDPAAQSLGAVAHSVRAAPLDEIERLWREARRRGLVFHMHVEEQPGEIDEARAAWGATPMRLLNRRLPPDAAFTAVHCTHTDPGDLAEYAAHGGRICICPLTEANLGDGTADLPAMLVAGVPICLGTDSNARISMLEEMRWLEYGQRLARRERGLARDERGRVAPWLLAAATTAGAGALGVPAGAIEPGRWADFAAVDLEHPSLAGCPVEAAGGGLAAALVFGAADGAIAATAVGGRWRATAGSSWPHRLGTRAGKGEERDPT